MGIEFKIIDDPPADSHLWKDWKKLVDVEGWTSDDNSVTLLTPSLKSTRSVFAVTSENENFVGTVVWNEYDGFSFLGFFLLAPEYRGKGCGMQLWERALNRMPKESILGLRGVPIMVDKYRSKDTPVLGNTLINYRLKTAVYLEAVKSLTAEEQTSKLVSELSAEEWKKLLDYDKAVNGRDRSEFLERYYKKLNITTGLVLFDSEHNVIAHISSVFTGQAEDNVLKISPLYADSDEIAMSALKQFAKVVNEKYPTAEIIFHILDTEKGNLIGSFFKSIKLESKISGVTLFSREIPKLGNETKVYIAHNNSCHYDY